jgi:hypothetical protein
MPVPFAGRRPAAIMPTPMAHRPETQGRFVVPARFSCQPCGHADSLGSQASGAPINAASDTVTGATVARHA